RWAPDPSSISRPAVRVEPKLQPHNRSPKRSTSSCDKCPAMPPLMCVAATLQAFVRSLHGYARSMRSRLLNSMQSGSSELAQRAKQIGRRNGVLLVREKNSADEEIEKSAQRVG